MDVPKTLHYNRIILFCYVTLFIEMKFTIVEWYQIFFGTTSRFAIRLKLSKRFADKNMLVETLKWSMDYSTFMFLQSVCTTHRILIYFKLYQFFILSKPLNFTAWSLFCVLYLHRYLFFITTWCRLRRLKRLSSFPLFSSTFVCFN